MSSWTAQDKALMQRLNDNERNYWLANSAKLPLWELILNMLVGE